MPQLCAAPETQVPVPLQVAAATSVVVPLHAAARQTVPAAKSWQAPAPSQEPLVPQVDAVCAVQPLWGSVPTATLPQVPSAPLPLFAAEQAWQAEVQATLQQVGLSDFSSSKPASLSGGMKMRVSIARALVSKPKILLMDEPFAALDEFTRHKLQEDMRELWRRSGTTIVFVTHSIYEAAYLATRVLVMSARPGRISASIDCNIADSADRRSAPDYIAMVKRLSDMLRLEFSA